MNLGVLLKSTLVLLQLVKLYLNVYALLCLYAEQDKNRL